MSTRIGTLQAPRATRSIWPAAVVASLLMLTVGIGAFFLGRDSGTTDPKAAVEGVQATLVGGTAANTPSELSGGIVGATPAEGVVVAASGVTAGSSSIAIAATADMQAAIIAARNAADPPGGATTQDEPIMVNGHVCGQCG